MRGNYELNGKVDIFCRSYTQLLITNHQLGKRLKLVLLVFFRTYFNAIRNCNEKPDPGREGSQERDSPDGGSGKYKKKLDVNKHGCFRSTSLCKKCF